MAYDGNLKNIKLEPLKFSAKFSELYCKIIPKIYNLEDLRFLEDVKRELKNIRKWKQFLDKWKANPILIDFKFEELVIRCAYMFSYSVINTSVVYSEFSHHLKENKSTLLSHFSKKIPNLCCLAGGPGTEVVGVVKAIHDVIWQSNSEDMNKIVDVHVTVVDLCAEWKPEVFAIVNAINNSSDLFPHNKVQFHAEFLKADLLKPFEETLQKTIKEANIVTIVKFVNSVNEKNPLDCIPELRCTMERVIGCMSEESCLFMLDTAGGKAFYRTADVICKHRSAFERQMVSHKTYSLNPKTVKKIESVMNFGKTSTLFPTQLTKVTSCIWFKIPLPPKEKKKKEKRKELENA